MSKSSSSAHLFNWNIVYVDTYGTGANGKSDKELSEIVKEKI